MMKKTLIQLVKNNYDYFFLVAIILFAVLFKLLLLGNEITHGIQLTNTLDYSWQSDSIERFSHGYIAGKDFIFTYGPFFQFIYSLPAIIFKQSSYVSVLYAPILLTVFNILLLFFIIKSATHEKKAPIVVTILLLVFVGLLNYDPNSLFRMLLPFFYGILLFRFISIKKSISFKTLPIFLLPALFGAYTFDLFILCFLITILFVGHELYFIYKNSKAKTKIKQFAIKGSLFVACAMLFEILLSFLLTKNLNYLLYSFDTVKNYQFVMSIPWSANKYYLLLFVPLGLCMFILYVIRKTTLNKNDRLVFIFLTIIALLQMKTAFIRADDAHILMGIYPSVIILVLVSYMVFREKVTALLIILFLLFSVIIPLKNNSLDNISFQNFSAALSIQPNQSFFSLYKLPDNYYFNQKDFVRFESLIRKNPGKVMVYPYDSYLLNAYNQTYNTLALQFYQYSNSLVEEKSVEELSKSPPQFIILGVDDKGAVRLDNIPNFSRNPLLAKWMFANYTVDKKTENYIILRLDINKKTKSANNVCSIFTVDSSNIMHTQLFERFIKSSTYYLESDSGIRLPYMPGMTEIFFVEKFNDSDTLQKLFEESFDFSNYDDGEKKLNVIKKYPFPKVTKTFNSNFSIKCYY